MKEEYIWLITVGVIVIVSLFVRNYIKSFPKWLQMSLWLLYIPAIIYSVYCFFTLDIHNYKIYWGVLTIIMIFKMYRNRYLIMKE
jgi:hypothetical protein